MKFHQISSFGAGTLLSFSLEKANATNAILEPSPADVSLTLELSMAFGFFDQVVDTELPSLDEFQALMDVTASFYINLLEPLYPALDSDMFQLDFVDSFFDENADPALLMVHFDAIVTFQVIDDVNEMPCQEDLFEVMEGANYQDYITQYVSSIDDSIFFDTQEVEFSKRYSQCPEAKPMNWEPCNVSPKDSCSYGAFSCCGKILDYDFCTCRDSKWGCVFIEPMSCPGFGPFPQCTDFYRQEDVLYGDTGKGECYSVQRRIERIEDLLDPSNHSTTINYLYFNGGADMDGSDTAGYSENTYANLTLSFNSTGEGCTVSVPGVSTCPCKLHEGSVDGDGGGVREWTQIYLEECSALDGTLAFPSGSQTIRIWNGDPFPPLDYTNEFFLLVEDEQRCDGPASGFDSQKDVLLGNTDEGDCYNIERSIVRHPQEQSTECSTLTANYTYYIGGLDSYGIDTGFPREIYYTVIAEIHHNCANHEDDYCSVKVDGVGTCNTCTFNSFSVSDNSHPAFPNSTGSQRSWSELELLDCSNLGGVFPNSSQKIEFWSREGNEEQYYTDEYLSLRYNQEHCEHPSIVTNEPSTRCYDEVTNGEPVAGRCFAVDRLVCIEEWPDGCTRAFVYMEYYNQESSQGTDTYHVVQTEATYGCDPQSVPSQPENGCSIGLRGENCDCVNVGSEISLVAGCAENARVFQPPQQAISLLEAGAFFDVAETADMCNFPSVTTHADRGSGVDLTSRAGADSADTSIVPIKLVLRLHFSPGNGQEPCIDAMNILALSSIEFFRKEFRKDSVMKDVFRELSLEGMEYLYLADAADEVEMEMKALVTVTSGSVIQDSKVAEVFTQANLSRFLREAVRRNKLGIRNELFHVDRVFLKAISRAS